MTGSDKAWERWGSEDPYYGVVSHDKFHKDRLSANTLDDFFESGERHIQWLFDTIRQRVDPTFAPTTAIDFGCGTGRLLLPLARRCRRVVGVDVSPSMLAEAARNCADRSASNVELVLSDHRLSRVEGEYDLVHSYIVFQHVSVARGERVFRALLDHLSLGGVGACHFTYEREAPFHRKLANWLRHHVPGVHNVLNVVQGRPFRKPPMEMNRYSLGRLMKVLQAGGYERVTCEFTNHSGHLGVILCFQRRRPL